MSSNDSTQYLTLLSYCPCLSFPSFVWWYVVYLSGSESVHVFFYHFVIYALLLETQLSRAHCWDTINPFYPATLLCLSQARASVFDVICRGRLWVQWVQLRWEVILHFADICGIDDHHCLAFLSQSVRMHILIVTYSHVTYRYTLYYWLLIHFRVWHYCNCRKPW